MQFYLDQFYQNLHFFIKLFYQFDFSTPTWLGEDNYDFNLKNNLVPLQKVPYFENSKDLCDLEEYNEAVQRKVLVELLGSNYEHIDNPNRETDTIILEELIKKNYHQTKNAEIFDLIKILVNQKEKYEYN